MIRVLIVDDEPLARARVRDLLAAHDDVTVVGEAMDGNQAEAQLRAVAPNLVFLDIQLPKLSGIQVLERLRSLPAPPHVVFTTASEDHALQAFEYSAVDYLVKPLDARRFDRALERARRACRAAANDDLRLALEAETAAAPPRRFALRVGNRVRFLDPATIDYFLAEGDYVAVHAAKETLLVRERLKDLHLALTAHGFVRIHRSTLINAERVREIRPSGTGEYEVLLEDGTSVTTSAAYRDDVERLMRPARAAPSPAA